MIRTLIKYAVMFVSLVLIQVLVLNQVQLGGFINPYIYILFVILLPLNSPRYAVLILGFLIGLTIDVFSNSLGIHAAATVFIAYLRPLVIRSISNREEDRSEYPGLHQSKFRWFLSYVGNNGFSAPYRSFLSRNIYIFPFFSNVLSDSFKCCIYQFLL